jgi:tRNA G10  N-methylase Trm11
MEKFIFVLGRNPELSLAEIKSHLFTQKIKFNVLSSNSLAALIETDSLSCKEVIKHLGGTLKIGRTFNSMDNLYLGTSNKIKYGLSNYDDLDISDYHLALKNYFKRIKLKAMLKKSQSGLPYLSPSESKNVTEVLQFSGYYAKTEAIFDGKYLSHLDSDRPISGQKNSTPLRLSRIMLNLAEVNNGSKILNPYCKIGSIAQEALFFGASVKVSDPNLENQKSTKSNLEWVKIECHPKGSYTIERNLQKIKGRNFLCICEPPLGPFFRALPNESQAKSALRALYPVYNELMDQIYPLSQKIVIISPVYRVRNDSEVPFNFETVLSRFKFAKIANYRYESPSSKIVRIIWVLTK